MRNLKKLLAVIVTIAMVATFAIPAFAETKTDADIVKDLGMLKGAKDGVTADYLASQPTKLQAAIMLLRLMGKEAEALAFTGTDSFADAEKMTWVGGKAILAYLKAHPEYGFKGDSAGNFNFNEKITAKQYTKILLVVLGYVEGTDFTWANVLAFAGTKGLVKTLDAEPFTVNDLAIATVEALKTNVKGGAMTLAAQLVAAKILVEADAVTAGVYTIPVVALAVDTVSSVNLANFVVSFTQPIDDTTLTATTAVVTVNGASNVYTKAVAADKKSVTFAFSSNVSQNDTIKVTLDGIKDKAGVAMPKFEKTFAAKDVTDPVAGELKVINNKKFDLYFSEPVALSTGVVYKTSDVANTAALLKIDGNLVFVKYTPSAAENKITVDLFNSLSDGAHTVSISEVKDFAGFKIAAKDYTVTTAADVVAPKAVSVTNSGVNKIIISFDEEIDAAVATATITVKETGNAADLHGAGAIAVGGTDKKTVEVTLNTPFTAASTLGYVVTYKNVPDVFGNKTTTDQTVNGSVADDTAVPTLASYKVLDNNKIELVFSEKVVTTAATFKLYPKGKSAAADLLATYTNANLAAAASAVANGYDLTLAYFAGKDPAEYDILIEGITDDTVRKNAMAAKTITVVAKDAKAPTVVSSYRLGVPGASHKVELNFSEAMDAAKLANVANYFLGTGANADKAISTISGATVTVAAGNKKVTINIPDADGANYVVVGCPALTDTAGQLVTNAPITAAFAITVGGYPSFVAANVTVEATTKNTIKVTAAGGHVFSAADANGFKFVDANATVLDLGVIAAQVSADGTYVTLTTSVALAADATADTADDVDVLFESISLYVTGTNITDTNGKALTILVGAPVAVADKIVATQTTTTVGAGANADKLTIAFDEAVTYAAGWNASNLASAIEVKIGTTALIPNTDYTAAVAAGNVVVTIVKAGVVAADVITKITTSSALTDVPGNAVVVSAAAATTSAVTEKTVPTIVSARTLSATTLEITFSEAITSADLVNAGAQFQVDANDDGDFADLDDVSGTGAITVSGNKIVVTYAAATFVTLTDIGGVKYTEVAGDEMTDIAANKVASPVTLVDANTTSAF